MPRSTLAPAPPPPGALDAAPYWVDGFLPPAVRAQMLEELRWAFWKPSTVVELTRAGELRSRTSAARVSESTDEAWFSDALKDQLRAVEGRLTEWFGIRPEQCERWQATRYPRGGTFDYHFDCGYWGHEPAGDREHTILIYLKQPAEGGSTRFRELDLDVEPRAGRLLVWKNLLPNGERNPAMLHSSVPIVRGTKTVLVTWARQRDVRTPSAEGT